MELPALSLRSLSAWFAVQAGHWGCSMCCWLCRVCQPACVLLACHGLTYLSQLVLLPEFLQPLLL